MKKEDRGSRHKVTTNNIKKLLLLRNEFLLICRFSFSGLLGLITNKKERVYTTCSKILSKKKLKNKNLKNIREALYFRTNI